MARSEHKKAPVALVLTRQKLPVLDTKEYANLSKGVKRGGYVLADSPNGEKPDVILIASGSEVHLALQARQKLHQGGVNARVVSLPSWNIFDTQADEYKNEVLPRDIPMLAIEAGSTLGWRSYVGPQIDVIGVDRFGASAPGEKVYQEYGFTVDNIYQHVMALVAGKKVLAK
jgi:transketolase